jgi:hypothetical protein
VKEWFIEGTVPTEVDNTKVGIEIDTATGNLWQEGCVGPKEVTGFLNLGGAESEFSSWGKYNRDWLARAERGSGVAGGPERTRTSYFYETGVWNPFGKTWGAPFAPTELCEIPLPTPEPFPTESFWPWDSPPPGETPTPDPGNGGGGGGGGGKPTPQP